MDKIIVCRCEEVTLQDMEDTVKRYNCSGRELKLRTRAGMGYCGGRTCRPAVDAIIQKITGEQVGHNLPLKVQPPVRPLSLSVLGGITHEKQSD